MTDISREANPKGFSPRLEEICADRCAEVGDPACWRLPDMVEPCEKITPCADCLSARVQELEKANKELSEYSFEATKAIVGLTAGGSEFFAGELPDGRYKANLPICVKYVRDTKETLHKQVKWQFERGRLQALDEALEAVRKEQRFHPMTQDFRAVIEALKGDTQ